MGSCLFVKHKVSQLTIYHALRVLDIRPLISYILLVKNIQYILLILSKKFKGM